LRITAILRLLVSFEVCEKIEQIWYLANFFGFWRRLSHFTHRMSTKNRSTFDQIFAKVIGPVDDDDDEHVAEDAEEAEPPAKRRRGPGKKKSKIPFQFYIFCYLIMHSSNCR
jgi:hypothetical protein